MGSLILDFADQLYSFLALKYKIVSPRNAAEGGPPIEEYDWPTEVFTVDIARAVMMLSYTYRSSFRRHFRSVATLLCTSKENPKLYASIFAKVTYKRHSPLRILILCSFISEMYLFIFFRKGAENVNRHFTLPAMGCLNEIYLSVFKKIDDPIPKWEDVKRSATLIARGYDTLEPIMKTEHPSESKFFFTSVQDVLVEQGKMRCEPEGESGIAEAMPSTSTDYSSSVPVAHYDSLTDRQRSAMLAADQLADQLKEATLTKRDSPIGGEKSKSHRKKRQSHKTRACAKSDEPGPQAVASTSSEKSFTVEHSFVSMGNNKTVLKTTIKPVVKNISPLRPVSSVSQRLPGVGEEASVSEDQNTEAKSESPNCSKEIIVKTRSGSSISKAKSRKHKKKKV